MKIYILTKISMFFRVFLRFIGFFKLFRVFLRFLGFFKVFTFFKCFLRFFHCTNISEYHMKFSKWARNFNLGIKTSRTSIYQHYLQSFENFRFFKIFNFDYFYYFLGYYVPLTCGTKYRVYQIVKHIVRHTRD